MSNLFSDNDNGSRAAPRAVNGWTTDTSEFPVDINVTDDGAGQLVAAVSYPSGPPSFLNLYNATETTNRITATKNTAGANLTDGQFTFALETAAGAPVATAKNDVAGMIDFPEQTYSAPGVYEYIVKEITPPGGGWTTDSTTYRVNVTVIDNGVGQLVVSSVDRPDGAPAFRNVYTATPALAQLEAQKSATGATLSAGQFTFEIVDENGNVVASERNAADGSVIFPALSYNAPGSHHYYIREVPLS
jgi:pilin isopeptide linkage protein